MTIIERILEARFKVLQAGERIPNVLRLPPLEAAQLSDWLNEHVENDPFLGYTPFGMQLFGMLFFEDPSVTVITARYEGDATG